MISGALLMFACRTQKSCNIVLRLLKMKKKKTPSKFKKAKNKKKTLSFAKLEKFCFDKRKIEEYKKESE